MPKRPKFKYVAIVVIETSEKVTKKAIKDEIIATLSGWWKARMSGKTPDIAEIEAVRVRAVDFD